MKSRRLALAYKRPLLETIDDYLKILIVGLFVVSIIHILDDDRTAIVLFCSALVALFGHAYCNALLHYRQCLRGEVFFGGRIASTIKIFRDARRFRTRYCAARGIQ